MTVFGAGGREGLVPPVKVGRDGGFLHRHSRGRVEGGRHSDHRPCWRRESEEQVGQPTPSRDILMALVVFDRISKRYDVGDIAVNALRDISLEISLGSSLAIMGPSGSGKSTLLGILGCLDTPTSGRYLLAGEDVARMSPAGLAELRCRRFGFVFQNFNLLPRLTALENVEMPLAYAGQRQRARRFKATEMLKRVGLAERMTHYPSQLSGGQQQRVAIARALVNQPDLILADEPTGALDSATGQEILDLLDEVNAEGTTVVVVTHDKNVASAMRRTITLSDGCIGADTSRDPGSDLSVRRLIAS